MNVFAIDYDDGRVRAKAGDRVPNSIAAHRVAVLTKAKVIVVRHPLDHDSDGVPGGSLPGPAATAARARRRRK